MNMGMVWCDSDLRKNIQVVNPYHTRSLQNKVSWSRWREVEFMLEGWAIAYRSCLW